MRQQRWRWIVTGLVLLTLVAAHLRGINGQSLVSKSSANAVANDADDPIVYITRTGHKYHLAGCEYLKRSCIPIRLSVAKAEGYTPCSICDPPD